MFVEISAKEVTSVVVTAAVQVCRSASAQYLARVCMCVQADIVNRLCSNQKPIHVE